MPIKKFNYTDSRQISLTDLHAKQEEIIDHLNSQEVKEEKTEWKPVKCSHECHYVPFASWRELPSSQGCDICFEWHNKDQLRKFKENV